MTAAQLGKDLIKILGLEQSSVDDMTSFNEWDGEYVVGFKRRGELPCISTGGERISAPLIYVYYTLGQHHSQKVHIGVPEICMKDWKQFEIQHQTYDTVQNVRDNNEFILGSKYYMEKEARLSKLGGSLEDLEITDI